MHGDGRTKRKRIELDLSWMSQAACQGMDTAIFFPLQGQSHEPAVRVCEGCPVFEQCADYATHLSPNEPGIYAGLSQQQRKRRAGWDPRR